MPFMMEPMACSRTPKWRFRPAPVGRKSPMPFIMVLVDGARSAEPPIRNGALFAIALRTFPEALLVAIAPSFSVKAGSSLSQPLSALPSIIARTWRPSSGYSRSYLASVESQSFSSASPLESAFLNPSRTSSGTKNVGSSGQPSFSFVAFTSSVPRGAPWTSAVSCLPGLPKPIIVLAMMIDGLPASSFADSIALAIESRSLPPTCWTCQPNASNLLPTSSEKEMSVEPSIVILLSE